MEQTKFTRFKRISFIVFTNVLLIFCVWFICNNCYGYTTKPVKNIDLIENVAEFKDTVNNVKQVKQQKDSIEQLLISEVEKYMKTKTTRYHRLVPKYLVHAALNHNIDLCFMMAQTQIETCYGTTGAGRESSRKSLFGVSIRKYANYELAINDYCRILKKSYLGKGRTEHHLMTKYVTHKGGRYASNPKYENELKYAYKTIKKTTKIYSLQQEIKNI